MRHLLDVNVLIALFDPDHAFHRRAHAWWGTTGRPWASSPITENGLVRIMAAPHYSRATRFPASGLTARLRAWADSSDHEFWPDTVSLRDPSHFQLEAVLSARQLTDAYLLALAIARGGCLATFDQKLPVAAVIGATRDRIVVL